MVLTETPPLRRPAESPEATLVRLRRLLDVSLALSATIDTPRLLDAIAGTTTEILDCEAASILLLHETTGALRFEAATGTAGARLVGTEVPLRGSLAGTTILEDRIVHAADTATDARHHAATDAASGFVTRALLGVPMRLDGRPVGVLQALNPRRGRFDRADAEALLIVAAQAAVAIRNARHETALRRANDRLAELDRLKTNFLHIASHELRTPVTGVIGYGQILAEQVRADLHPFAAAVLEDGHRMLDVVETLDVMSSLEAERDAGGGTTSLRAVLAEAAADAAPRADVALPEAPLVVRGDPRRLRLAFGHVLRNAVQFSAPEGPVRLEARAEGGEARVVVADRGRGLEAADLDRIFEAYVQVQDPDRRDHEGLGVGLTIARAVVHQHGGRLWAESGGLGLGTTVRARLPLAA